METPDIKEDTRPDHGPGHLLTEARLKLGLEPQNVAEMLHLRSTQIQALEADDYENLPEPTYVKGYLRAYCQLLSLDPNPIVEMYSDFITPPVVESFEGLAPERQAVSNDNLVKLVSIGMVALVAGLAVTFWLSSSDQFASNQSMPSQRADVAQPGIQSANVDGSKESELITEESVAEAEPVSTASLQANKESSKPADIKLTESSTEDESGLTQEALITPNQDSPQTVSQSPSDSTAGIRNEVSLLPETDDLAHSRLLMKVTESSWIDVRDARDNKLIYETVPAGREIPLEGLAPFKVFLGNAAGVQVFLEEKEIDTTQYQRGLTARFNLAKPARIQ